MCLCLEEGDDDDDPEYNFLADIDEPDVEDYRNDKAVRITSEWFPQWLLIFISSAETTVIKLGSESSSSVYCSYISSFIIIIPEKEVNDLMEELFDAVRDDKLFSITVCYFCPCLFH